MTNHTLTIRKPLSSECRQVFDLVNQLKTVPLPFEPFEIIFTRNLDQDHIHYLVAEDNGQLIGFISIYLSEVLHHSRRVAEIIELVVDEPYRNRSVGEYLLNAAIERSRTHDCELLEVSSNNTRERAHHFYMRHGFGRTHAKLTLPL